MNYDKELELYNKYLEVSQKIAMLFPEDRTITVSGKSLSPREFAAYCVFHDNRVQYMNNDEDTQEDGRAEENGEEGEHDGSPGAAFRAD